MPEPRFVNLLSCILLENIDGSLVGIGRVVIAGHAFLKGERLRYPGQHVRIFLLRLVVEDEAALP